MTAINMDESLQCVYDSAFSLPSGGQLALPGALPNFYLKIEVFCPNSVVTPGSEVRVYFDGTESGVSGSRIFTAGNGANLTETWINTSLFGVMENGQGLRAFAWIYPYIEGNVHMRGEGSGCGNNPMVWHMLANRATNWSSLSLHFTSTASGTVRVWKSRMTIK